MANNKINKINVLGTIYDIGGGSGGGVEPQTLSGTITKLNQSSRTGSGVITYIKFNSPPTSDDDYNAFVNYDGNMTGDTEFTNVNSIYIWGYNPGIDIDSYQGNIHSRTDNFYVRTCEYSNSVKYISVNMDTTDNVKLYIHYAFPTN